MYCFFQYDNDVSTHYGATAGMDGSMGYGGGADHRNMQGHLAHSPGLNHTTPPGMQSPHYPSYNSNNSSMPGAVMTSTDRQLKVDKDSIYG